MAGNSFLMLNVGLARHDGDWNFRDINSPFARIYLVLAGEAMVEMGGRRHVLSPDHLYLIPPFTTHSDSCLGEFSHYYVHIYEDVGENQDFFSAFDFPFEIDAAEIDPELFERLTVRNRDMILKSSDPQLYDNEHSLIECVRFNRSRPRDVRMESAGIILQLISRFLQGASPKFKTTDERVARALNTISENVFSNVTVEDLARESCMSVGHFIRLFRKELGCTPAQLLIDSKLMKAKLMLATESLMVKEIAFRLGYEDVSYFIRLFKKHVGTTPSQYRQGYNK